MTDLELIKQKINIVDLIQEYLPLKKSGINFKAPCPFHSEHTPSFMVSPERGIWHCFGCQKGGDIFKFVMEKEGLEFKDALELLAKKAGVELIQASSKEKDSITKLYETNQKALQFYQYMLHEHPLGKPALEYLKKRGLTSETIKQFGIGYAPNNWEALTNFLRKRNYSLKEIIEAGLAVESRKGGYDRFRGRVIFPLINVKDQVLGFSGRILGKGEPKYINTPQTEIFDKSKLLFGLNLTKSEIRQKKEAIIVEGEMDIIASFQAGVKNIVCSKGTALTEMQVEIIKKYAETILLCFDADLAGDSAARRGIELADKAGLNIKVILIDKEKDPADVCLKDVEKWKEMVKEAVPIYDYYLSSVDKRFNIKTAMGKKQVFAELLPIWAAISDQMTREHYIQKLASLLQVKDELVRLEIKKTANNVGTAKFPKVAEVNKKDDIEIKDRRKLLEEYLISLLLHLPSTITYVPNFPETLFTQERLRQLYVLLVLFLDQISFQGKEFRIADFAKFVPDELVDQVDKLYLSELDERLDNPASWQKELDLVISELKKMLIKASLERLSLEIKQAQSFDKTDTLTILNKRFRDLSVKLKNL